MSMTQRVLPGLAGLTALVLGLTGCADPSPPTAEPGGGAVTVTNCGQALPFQTPPERAVTLDQSSTETMLALELADRMAGTANLKTKVAPQYAADYAKVPVLNPKLLTGEQLQAANPDFVIASFKAQYTADRVGTREELAELGLPSFVTAVECPEHNETGKTPFDLLFSDYEALGRVFGVEGRAGKLIEEQRAAVAEAGKCTTSPWPPATATGSSCSAGESWSPTGHPTRC
jgi:iron complex transport system substrate-binding protein